MVVYVNWYNENLVRQTLTWLGEVCFGVVARRTKAPKLNSWL